MKKGLAAVLLLVLCVCCGVVLYVPSAHAGYPEDCSLAEYRENVQKNNALIIRQLEATGAPTLREALLAYQKVSSSMDFYPTASETIYDAGSLFASEDWVPFFSRWRSERFLEKNYPNAMAYQRDYDARFHAYVEKGEQPPADFESEAYVYKDGSVIRFGVGGMSVQYPDGK